MPFLGQSPLQLSITLFTALRAGTNTAKKNTRLVVTGPYSSIFEAFLARIESALSLFRGFAGCVKKFVEITFLQIWSTRQRRSTTCAGALDSAAASGRVTQRKRRLIRCDLWGVGSLTTRQELRD